MRTQLAGTPIRHGQPREAVAARPPGWASHLLAVSAAAPQAPPAGPRRRWACTAPMTGPPPYQPQCPAGAGEGRRGGGGQGARGRGRRGGEGVGEVSEVCCACPFIHSFIVVHAHSLIVLIIIIIIKGHSLRRACLQPAFIVLLPINSMLFMPITVNHCRPAH